LIVAYFDSFFRWRAAAISVSNPNPLPSVTSQYMHPFGEPNP